MNSVSWKWELVSLAFVPRTWSTGLCCCPDHVTDIPSYVSPASQLNQHHIQVAFPLPFPASAYFPLCVSYPELLSSVQSSPVSFFSFPDSEFHVIFVPFCLTISVFGWENGEKDLFCCCFSVQWVIPPVQRSTIYITLIASIFCLHDFVDLYKIYFSVS